MSHSRRTLRRTILAALALLPLVGVAAEVNAHPPRVAPSHDFDVVVEDGFGQPLRTFGDRGRRFVLGRFGDRYSVRLVNRTARRVEAVLTIDGRDAVSGRPGDFVSQRGYLIHPFDSVVVTGFRKSFDEVATFRFTDPGDSYSARMGTPENVGVIGAAFFPERDRFDEPEVDSVARAPRPGRPQRRNPNPRAGGARRAAQRAPRADADAPASEAYGESRSAAATDRAPRSKRRRAERSSRDHLGTRYGESRQSSVVEVPFERADRSHPAAVLTIRYDDETGLEARGFEVHPPPPPPHWPWWRRRAPEAFPESRFAPPPP